MTFAPPEYRAGKRRPAVPKAHKFGFDGAPITENGEAARPVSVLPPTNTQLSTNRQPSDPGAGRLQPNSSRSPFGGIAEQELQILDLNSGKLAVSVQCDVGEIGLTLLQFHNPIFDGIGGDQLVHEDGFGLADPMRPVGGLVLGGGVPPWIIMDHRVSGGEVQPPAPSFQA